MSAETRRRELLEARWDVLMRDVQRFQGEAGMAQANSKRYYRIQNTLDELAAMLVNEIWDTEMDSTMRLTEGIWREIERRTLDWAEEIEAARTRRAGAAA